MELKLTKSFVRKIFFEGAIFRVKQDQEKRSLEIVEVVQGVEVKTLYAYKFENGNSTVNFHPIDLYDIQHVMELAHIDRYPL